MLTRPRVTFLVNGDEASAMAERARAFTARLSERFENQIVYRCGGKLRAAFRMYGELRRFRPRAIYVMDMAAAGMVASALCRLMRPRTRIVIDTGDAIYELAKSSGMRGPIGLAMTWLLERFSLALANHLVVRGTFHREHLISRGFDASRVTVIQDGVDLANVAPPVDDDIRKLRTSLGLDNTFVVGVVGSSVWSERLQMCYGWELVEMLRHLKDRTVKALLIGDGTGIGHLRRKCEEYGIVDRVVFAGRVSLEELPSHLSLMDVAISTQTNNLAGQVRTTGKLPLYLASGRCVLASRVGEAARVLDEAMLVDYVGTRDPDYPTRLAQRVEALLEAGAKPSPNAKMVELARKHFDYDILAQRAGAVLDAMTS